MPRPDDQEEQEPQGQRHPEEQNWEDVNNKRKYRSNGAKVVRGTAGIASSATSGASSVREGWKSSPREIFVYHTHHSTTEQDIRDLVSETSKVEVLEIEKRPREGAYFGSFRVRVNRDEFEKALSPECWPSGWSIREYFVARKKPEASNSSGQSKSPRNQSSNLQTS